MSSLVGTFFVPIGVHIRGVPLTSNAIHCRKNIEIVYSTGEKNTDEEPEEDFEKVIIDDKHPTPPLAEDEPEPTDPQNTDEREAVNENIC